MGQQDLDRLGLEGGTQPLKRLALFPRRHARIHHRQRPIAVVHHVGLLPKDIACKCMHHTA